MIMCSTLTRVRDVLSREIESSTDLIHQHVGSGVQPSSDRFIQDVFKTLLLSHDSIEEVVFVNVGHLDVIRGKDDPKGCARTNSLSK